MGQNGPETGPGTNVGANSNCLTGLNSRWLMGQDASDSAVDNLNVLYNIADVINKTAFGMMVWYAATMDTKASSSEE